MDLGVVEASKIGLDLAGPDHVLLGIVRVKRGVAVRILSDLNVGRSEIRRAVIKVLQGSGASDIRET